jgi:hypothetical protein
VSCALSLCVIARSEATKQSSRARSAPLNKRFFEARLPARGWIASLPRTQKPLNAAAFVRGYGRAQLDGSEAVVDAGRVLGIGENVVPVVFDGLANQFADMERIGPVVDPSLKCLDEFGAVVGLPTAPANRFGT